MKPEKCREGGAPHPGSNTTSSSKEYVDIKHVIKEIKNKSLSIIEIKWILSPRRLKFIRQTLQNQREFIGDDSQVIELAPETATARDKGKATTPLHYLAVDKSVSMALL